MTEPPGEPADPARSPPGASLPRMVSPLPGPRGAAFVDALASAECPAFTTRRARRAERSGSPHDPIVWAEAVGSNVVDVDGNVYVDFTGGFGVAALGHRPPTVVEAITRQAERALHALGDLHPADTKVTLLSRLAALGPWAETRVILSLTGSDAVTAALKTAAVATGRPAVIAFEGGYHGLGYGPLALCGYSAGFRAPFADQLNPHAHIAPWPTDGVSLQTSLDALESLLRRHAPGAVLLEPIQGRGGVRVPPPGFLSGVVERARAHGALVIADEILTGLRRCGPLLRSCAAEPGATPDLICLGKALGGGLPVSACLGDARVMAAWGDPDGEALHTGTFFGHPLGCAAALAALDLLEPEALADHVLARGRRLRDAVERAGVGEVRGEGLMLAVATGPAERTLGLVRALLERGFLVLPAGSDASALQLVPPFVITDAQIDAFAATLEELA